MAAAGQAAQEREQELREQLKADAAKRAAGGASNGGGDAAPTGKRRKRSWSVAPSAAAPEPPEAPTSAVSPRNSAVERAREAALAAAREAAAPAAAPAPAARRGARQTPVARLQQQLAQQQVAMAQAQQQIALVAQQQQLTMVQQHAARAGVFVSNLSDEAEAELRQKFAAFGPLVAAERTPQDRSKYFVAFADESAAVRAVSEMHNTVLGGRSIRVVRAPAAPCAGFAPGPGGDAGLLSAPNAAQLAQAGALSQMRFQQAAAVQQLSQQAHMLATQAQALGGDRTPDGALLLQQALAAKAQVQQMEQIVAAQHAQAEQIATASMVPRAPQPLPASGPAIAKPDAALSFCVYMSGLPAEWQEKDVRAVFASFGAVQQVALAGKTGRGWIEFADAATASSAASQMNGFDAGGGGELDVKVLTPTLLASLGGTIASSSGAASQGQAAAAEGEESLEESQQHISTGQRYALMQKLSRQQQQAERSSQSESVQSSCVVRIENMVKDSSE